MIFGIFGKILFERKLVIVVCCSRYILFIRNVCSVSFLKFLSREGLGIKIEI